jgi:PAS domain S-box-containing protein
MSAASRPSALPYLLALAAVIVAVALRVALVPLIGERFPFATVLLAVMVVSVRYGVGPGLFAVAAGLVGTLPLLPPLGVFWVEGLENQAGLALYALVGVAAALTGGASYAGAEALGRSQEQLHVTLESIGDAVIATDELGRVTRLNPTARRLTGWGDDALGQPIEQVMVLRHEITREPTANPAERVLREGVVVELANHTVLLGRDGAVTPIEDTAAPIRGSDGVVRGCVVVFRDVTESRGVRRRLEEREALLRAVIDHSPAVIFAKDPQGRYLLANQAAAALTGRPAEEILGKTDAAFFPPELAAAFAADDASVMGGGRARTYEEAVLIEGETRTAVTTKFPLRDPDGAMYGVCGISTDITSLRRAEQALHDSEERLRLALEAGRMGVWDWNIATGELAWSDTLEPIHGLQPGSFGGTFEAFLALVHSDDRARLQSTLEQALAQRASYELEFRVVWPDGSVRWMAGKGRIFTDDRGEPLRLIGVGMDVTERRQVEDAVRALLGVAAALGSTLELDELLDRLVREAASLASAQGGCAGLRTKGGMVAARLLRDGETRAMQARWAPGEGRPGRALLERAPQGGYDPQLPVRQAWCLPIVGGGEVLGFFEVHDPIGRAAFSAHDRERLVGVAHTAGLALQNALAYRELEEARRELVEADRRKDDFLATLAHELRNPLASIRHAVELLRRPGPDPDVLPRARGVIERQVQQLVRLIEDLLDVSRITRDRLELRKEPVLLSAVIELALEATRPLIEEGHHALTVSLPASPAWLEADLTRLAQVFGNLLSNAAKYTPRGGQIVLSAEVGDEQVRVVVHDTGQGIAPEHLPRLFEGFAWAGPVLERSQGGLGIGLALVRALVERHGGRVEARSEGLGRGSEFIVSLPRGRPPAKPAPTPSEPAQPAPYQILVVDDNEDAADALSMLLQMMGQQVQTAHDGVEGVAAEAALRPDLVLLDIGMPRMNGYDAARQIRARPGPQPVLVALTGWGQQSDRQKAAEAGFDLHLTKPVEPEALVRLLGELPRLRRGS